MAYNRDNEIELLTELIDELESLDGDEADLEICKEEVEDAETNLQAFQKELKAQEKVVLEAEKSIQKLRDKHATLVASYKPKVKDAQEEKKKPRNTQQLEESVIESREI